MPVSALKNYTEGSNYLDLLRKLRVEAGCCGSRYFTDGTVSVKFKELTAHAEEYSFKGRDIADRLTLLNNEDVLKRYSGFVWILMWLGLQIARFFGNICCGVNHADAIERIRQGGDSSTTAPIPPRDQALESDKRIEPSSSDTSSQEPPSNLPKSFNGALPSSTPPAPPVTSLSIPSPAPLIPTASPLPSSSSSFSLPTSDNLTPVVSASPSPTVTLPPPSPTPAPVAPTSSTAPTKRTAPATPEELTAIEDKIEKGIQLSQQEHELYIANVVVLDLSRWKDRTKIAVTPQPNPYGPTFYYSKGYETVFGLISASHKLKTVRLPVEDTQLLMWFLDPENKLEDDAARKALGEFGSIHTYTDLTFEFVPAGSMPVLDKPMHKERWKKLIRMVDLYDKDTFKRFLAVNFAKASDPTVAANLQALLSPDAAQNPLPQPAAASIYDLAPPPRPLMDDLAPHIDKLFNPADNKMYPHWLKWLEGTLQTIPLLKALEKSQQYPVICPVLESARSSRKQSYYSMEEVRLLERLAASPVTQIPDELIDNMVLHLWLYALPGYSQLLTIFSKGRFAGHPKAFEDYIGRIAKTSPQRVHVECFYRSSHPSFAPHVQYMLEQFKLGATTLLTARGLNKIEFRHFYTVMALDTNEPRRKQCIELIDAVASKLDPSISQQIQWVLVPPADVPVTASITSMQELAPQVKFLFDGTGTVLPVWRSWFDQLSDTHRSRLLQALMQTESPTLDLLVKSMPTFTTQLERILKVAIPTAETTQNISSVKIHRALDTLISYADRVEFTFCSETGFAEFITYCTAQPPSAKALLLSRLLRHTYPDFKRVLLILEKFGIADPRTLLAKAKVGTSGDINFARNVGGVALMHAMKIADATTGVEAIKAVFKQIITDLEGKPIRDPLRLAITYSTNIISVMEALVELLKTNEITKGFFVEALNAILALPAENDKRQAKFGEFFTVFWSKIPQNVMDVEIQDVLKNFRHRLPLITAFLHAAATQKIEFCEKPDASQPQQRSSSWLVAMIGSESRKKDTPPVSMEEIASLLQNTPSTVWINLGGTAVNKICTTHDELRQFRVATREIHRKEREAADKKA